MGVSDPEIQKKVFGPRWQDGNTEFEEAKLATRETTHHRFRPCPVCRPKLPGRKGQCSMAYPQQL